MQAKQRIVICRLSFVLLCLVPTLAVCLWIAGQSAAAVSVPNKSDWERQLTARLGLLVEIEAARYSASQTTQLQGLTVRDPETRDVIATASVLDVAEVRDGWIVGAKQLIVDANQLLRLREVLEDRILRGPISHTGGESSSIVIAPSDIHLRSRNLAQTLHDVEGGLYFSAEQTGITLKFGLPGSNAAPTQLTLHRRRNTSPPETTWQMETAGQAVPCSYLASAVPQLARLGSECRFAGGLTIGVSERGTTGSLAGTFSDVDFDALVTEHFPHQLSGQGRIHIERAAVEQGKLVELRGTLDAQNGSLSPSLLAAAQEHLQLRLGDELLNSDAPSVPFQRLGLGFHLDGKLLRLSSPADTSPRGAVLTGAEGPLLEVAASHAVPAVNLLRALLPDNEFQVPATRQTDALIGLLPVPDLAPERTAALPSHTPTRLRPSGPAEAAPVLRQPGLR